MKELAVSFTEELVKLVGNLAWPSLVFFIACRYQKEFQDLLTRLGKAKIGPAEFTLEKVEKSVIQSAEETSKLLEKSLRYSNLLSQNRSNEDTTEIRDLHRAIRVADIDNDDQEEIIISQFEGSYWSRIRVFKPIARSRGADISIDFILLGEIFPVNFLEEVRDFDSDHIPEIIVNEDEIGEKPHVIASKDEVVYKWIDSSFHPISRKRVHEISVADAGYSDWNRDQITPPQDQTAEQTAEAWSRWFEQVDQIELDLPGLGDSYKQKVIDKFKKQGLEL